MKKIFLVTLLFTLLNCSDDYTILQPPPPAPENVFLGDVELWTQQEVDDFGAERYTNIEGSLTIINLIDNPSIIPNLNSLIDLREITGDLTILETNTLENLNGLNNLTTIGGGIEILNNIALININSLENLSNLGTFINITQNNSLVNINGLFHLDLVNDNILISGNTVLTNLIGLANITQAKSLKIDNNPALESLDLNSLVLVESNLSGDGLVINNNDLLTDLNELTSLETIIGSLSIIDNIDLTSIAGLINLTEIGAWEMNNNDYLHSLEGLNNLTTIQSSSFESYLLIKNNWQMTLEDLSNLESLQGSLIIENNKFFYNFIGLENLTSISGSIQLNDNENFENLNGLDNLISLTNNFDVNNNTRLQDYCAVEGLFNSNGLGGTYIVANNQYNPTQQDIIDGNCSL